MALYPVLSVAVGLMPSPSLGTAWGGCGHGAAGAAFGHGAGQRTSVGTLPCPMQDHELPRLHLTRTPCPGDPSLTGEQPAKRGCPRPLSPAHRPLPHPPPSGMATSHVFDLPAGMGEGSTCRQHLQAAGMNPPLPDSILTPR